MPMTLRFWIFEVWLLSLVANYNTCATMCHDAVEWCCTQNGTVSSRLGGFTRVNRTTAQQPPSLSWVSFASTIHSSTPRRSDPTRGKNPTMPLHEPTLSGECTGNRLPHKKSLVAVGRRHPKKKNQTWHRLYAHMHISIYTAECPVA